MGFSSYRSSRYHANDPMTGSVTRRIPTRQVRPGERALAVRTVRRNQISPVDGDTLLEMLGLSDAD